VPIATSNSTHDAGGIINANKWNYCILFIRLSVLVSDDDCLVRRLGEVFPHNIRTNQVIRAGENLRLLNH
jgi:hypothetical protein